jgi:hypothetical protein
MSFLATTQLLNRMELQQLPRLHLVKLERRERAELRQPGACAAVAPLWCTLLFRQRVLGQARSGAAVVAEQECGGDVRTRGGTAVARTT